MAPVRNSERARNSTACAVACRTFRKRDADRLSMTGNSSLWPSPTCNYVLMFSMADPKLARLALLSEQLSAASARALGPSTAAALRVGGFQPGRLQFSHGHSHPPVRRQIKVNKTTLRATLAAGAALVVATSLVAAGSAQASTLPTLTLTLSKSSIADGGSTQSGAVNVVSTASGLKEPSAILFLLKPGVSVAEVESAMKSGVGKDPNNTSKYGSIVFDTEVPPGKSSEAQTNLQPGQYLALIPGEGKGSEAHTAFTVVAAKSPATLPTPQATIRSIEFGFRGPKTLHDGEVVRFENEGFLVHMDVCL